LQIIIYLEFSNVSGNSSVNMVIRLRTGRRGFDFWQEQRFFLFVTVSGSVAHPTSYPMGTGGRSAGAWRWPLTST